MFSLYLEWMGYRWPLWRMGLSWLGQFETMMGMVEIILTGHLLIPPSHPY